MLNDVSLQKQRSQIFFYCQLINFVVKSGGVWGFLCNFAMNSIKYVRMRFLGNIEAKADAKGRVFLPAVFRKELQAFCEERLVLRKDIFQPCLVLYPESVWNDQIDILRQRLYRWNKDEWKLFRQFVSDVEPVALDGNGRFLIPKRYMKLANIEQTVKFIGIDDTIEIWNAETANEPFMEPNAFGEELQQIMSRENNYDE